MSKKHTFKVGKYISMACLLFVCATVQSCRDEYYYDDREPDFLGASIYEYLEEKGEFTLFMKVIEDLNYKEVLSKTGSKTLFVANDSAFLKGIKEEWGIESYEQLTPAHKRIILYNSMLDNAYLLELMSNMPSVDATSEPVIGRCLRQVTSSNITDSIGLFFDADLPQNNKDWDRFRQNGIRLALDATSTTMVHFLEEQLYQNSISAEDLNILLNNRYNATIRDAFIFDKMVIDKNVTCKNGYVHQLDGLLIPPSNMAEEIRLNGDERVPESERTRIFSSMIDRYSVPVYNEALTAEYNRIYHYGDEANAEKVYEKRYYATTNRGSSTAYDSYIDIDEIEHEAVSQLLYDPGWNEYRAGSSSKENDMAAMLVPSDKALNEYFTIGEGQSLIERYKHIDSIPLDKLSELVNIMMQTSFNTAVPSRFANIMDDARDPMGVKKEDIEKCIIANNGVVYVTNKVYSPASFVAVSAPLMFVDTLNIADWIMGSKERGCSGWDYDKYLLSMGSHFSLVVPSDGCFRYIDPFTINDSEPLMHIFTYDSKNKVTGQTWKCDPVTMEPKTLENKNLPLSRMENLLKQMCEYYIVVGDFTNGNKYHMAKGYGTVKVEFDPATNKVTHLIGGLEAQNGTSVPVGHTYPQKNGNTFRIDEGMIQPPTQSVYKILSDSINHPEFRRFFELCAGNADVINLISPINKKNGQPDSTWRYEIFTSIDRANKNYTCLDMNVSTFNTYHYTIYVPTNEQIEDAFSKGLPNWNDMGIEAEAIGEKQLTLTEKEDALNDLKLQEDVTPEQIAALQAEIDALTEEINANIDVLRKEAELVVNFVKYHIQDNSVYVDNLPHSIIEGKEEKFVVKYETAALDQVTKRFSAVTVETQQGSYNTHPTISITSDIQGYDKATCYVINKPDTEGKQYNIMTRDTWFQKASGNVETSSYAVIHQIDGFLVNERIFDATTNKFKK